MSTEQGAGGSIPPPPQPNINLRAFNRTHETRSMVPATLLTSGVAVISATAVKGVRAKLCPHWAKRKRCNCLTEIQGGRVRPGECGTKFVDPCFRWFFSARNEPDLNQGTAFSAAEALAGAKGAATLHNHPISIRVVQLDFPRKAGTVPNLRTIYGGLWNPETSSWEDYLHPDAPPPRDTPTNQGHGEDSAPLEPPTPFRFHDTEPPPPRRAG